MRSILMSVPSGRSRRCRPVGSAGLASSTPVEVGARAAVPWTTAYLADALDALRAEGQPVSEEAVTHLTPAQHDHIAFHGEYSFDLEAEQRRDGSASPPPTITLIASS
jgi:hypothetical protein